MKESFQRAWDFTMRWEGGGKLHTVPGDPGGTTKWGIAKRYNPDIDVPNLTEAQAQKIARREYWDKCRCDDLPEPIDILVFDAAFNMGWGRAGKFLQLSLNHFGASLKVDGAIGPLTLAATNQVSDTDYWCIPRQFMLHRLRFYNRRISEAPSQTKFIAGWMNRVFALLEYVGMGDFSQPY
jgi:lysozyme family protein